MQVIRMTMLFTNQIFPVTCSTMIMYISVMHQSIPAVPIPPPPPGISRAFAHVLIPGVGHLKFYHCPGVGHLPTPGTTPGHLTR